MSARLLLSAALLAGLMLVRPAPAAHLVRGGKPVAVIVRDAAGDNKPAKPGRKRAAGLDEAAAADLLAEWIKKITGAELPVTDRAPEKGPAILVGRAAVRAGLKLDDIPSPTREGLRIVVEDRRVLLGGQGDAATFKAACRFLEHLGCRYFMDGPLGEVFPSAADLSVAPVTLTEKPALLYRNPKGPTWMGGYWKAWNGAGGDEHNHAHAWGRYIPKGLFAEHPEYFALGADGQRKDGDWLCTSNPGARQAFAAGVVAAIKAGVRNPSISPPDGRGYCQCPVCKAQDDPRVLEPSSGSVSVTNRYVDFFDAVARRVAKERPEAVLSFYCYADYTQAPTTGRQLSPNLCAVIAPIRYCRLHPLGDPNCPSRTQQREMLDGWGKAASRLGYYAYMYNLADATLPMFKGTACRTEFPALADRGLSVLTLEVVSNWYIYGPMIYLSTRMAYDPKLDAAALMEDYFAKFYGPDAAPFMKDYWTTVDEAALRVPCHSGGFYGLAAAYTPEVVRRCETALARAAGAAKGVHAERVAMHAAGFQNVQDYKAIEAAMARGDFARAGQVHDGMVQRIEGLAARGQANREYGTAYLRRFLWPALEGGRIATAAPGKVLRVLPDLWRFHHDDAGEGELHGYARADCDDSSWRTVKTHSATLSGQGVRENSVLWYRARFPVPEKHGRLSLVFPEVDGAAAVWVNGQPVEPRPLLPLPAKKPGAPALPRRAPFAVDVTEAVRPGDNVVAVRADNRKISELFLGGILRPVLLVDGAP